MEAYMLIYVLTESDFDTIGKEHDLQLYDVHSEATFYSVKDVCDKTYRVLTFIGKPIMELLRNEQSKNSLNMINID